MVIAPNPVMPPGRVAEHSLGSYMSLRITAAEVGQWAEELIDRVSTQFIGSELFPTSSRHQLACLDIETTGLSVTPVFLIGILHWGAQGLHIHQLLARDYSEEPALLAATAELLSEVNVLISFNGRSFDIPFLRDRIRYHHMPWTIQPEQHVDILWVARRQQLDVPNHRLTTLESRLCRRWRGGDIPGEFIPAAYHQFVDTGETEQLALILQHNQIDLLTTAELAARWQGSLKQSK